MRRQPSLILMALALSLLATGNLRAQESPATAPGETGVITGKVVDAEGKPVAGAQVYAVNPPKKRGPSAKKNGDAPARLSETTTREDGTYTLASLPAGKVMIVAEKEGVGMARTEKPVNIKAGNKKGISPLTLAPASDEPANDGNARKKKKKESPAEK